MSKVKTVDVSTSLTPLSKIDRGPMIHAEMLHPGKDDWRKRLILALDLWSLEETSLTIYQFCREYGISYPTFMKWCVLYEDLGIMREEVKLRLGDQHYRDAYRKKASETMVLRDLHKYLPEWHDINKYHADLKKAEEKQDGIQVVYIEKVPSTGKVPEKKAKAIETESSNE